jgi:hypothetical protein
MRGDPAVARLSPLIHYFTNKAMQFYSKQGDQKMIHAIINLNNQYNQMVNSASRIVGQLRGELDWTVEDYQKGWPERR